MLFQVCYVNGIIPYITFWEWGFLGQCYSLGVPQVFMYLCFLLFAVHDPKFDYSRAERPWGYFRFLLTMNNAMNFVIGFA